MGRPAVLLCMDRKNWYSFVPLVNSLDGSGVQADIMLSSDPIQDLRTISGKHDPIIVLVSFFTSQRRRIQDLVSGIRSEFGRGVKLIAGGAHPTGLPDDALRLGFDLVVRGEGELILPQIIEDLISRQGRELTGIVEGKRLEDLDRFPPVSFSRGLFPPMEITRGCLFKCGYCSVPCIFGSVRHRSVESIIRTGRRLVKLVSRWDFRFISPNSLGYGSFSREPNEDAVERLLRALRDLEGEKRIFLSSFPSEARPDFVTERMVQLISEYADNRTVSIGAQSGSDRLLEKMSRGHDLDCVFRACDIILEVGLRPVVDFILGFPGETEFDQFQTIDAMRQLIDLSARVRVHHFLPLAGAPVGGMDPSPVGPEVLREIGRMTVKGLASGAFNHQMRLASMMREDLYQDSGGC